MKRQNKQGLNNDSARNQSITNKKNALTNIIDDSITKIDNLPTLDQNIKSQLTSRLTRLKTTIRSDKNAVATSAGTINEQLKEIRDSLPKRFENLTPIAKQNHSKVEDMFTTAINKIDDIRRSFLPNRISLLLENKISQSTSSDSADKLNKEKDASTTKKNY